MTSTTSTSENHPQNLPSGPSTSSRPLAFPYQIRHISWHNLAYITDYTIHPYINPSENWL
ncbi:hypothetical protein AZE42_10752 [Rhizopogon vesiculosus]|uniref:Uncharacterized protein n=1 Tax=Rhizopogon vesiculosus TaxID=180088 RepID=A0A1J8Q2Q3_9AGAM|nr:hypothetical protein AZE42_10752 [Rhizopogon vesiculosus]